MEIIGLDLHKRESQLCRRFPTGPIRYERIPTSRAQFTATLGGIAPAQILLEASTESEWVATHLESLGHTVIVADPNFDTAEFAVMVRTDQKGRGLGFQLMTELIAYARSRQLRILYGDVLRENVTMLEMARDLGFVQEDTAAPDIVKVTIDLSAETAGLPAAPQPAST